MFPLGNAARATRWVSLGIGAISCGWSDIAILLGSKDGDQTPSLQTLLASGLCEITLRCLMMPHEIGIGPRLMSCKSEFASSIILQPSLDIRWVSFQFRRQLIKRLGKIVLPGPIAMARRHVGTGWCLTGHRDSRRKRRI